MNSRIGLLALAVLLLSAGLVFAAEREGMQGGSGLSQSPAAAAQVVTGEVLKIEGQNYTVKDASGKEVRFVVDKETKVQGQFKEGDKIEAQIAADGTADYIKKARQ